MDLLEKKSLEKIRPERVRIQIQEIGKDSESEINSEPEKEEKEEKEILKSEIVENTQEQTKFEKHVEKTLKECKSSDVLDISSLSLKEPSCFMDFERDFKRFKSNPQVLYHYIKVNYCYNQLLEIGSSKFQDSFC